MKHIVLIDNYDSFTYNLVQAFAVLGARVSVFYNDQISVERAAALQPSHLVISPGPGTPAEAGVSSDMIRHFHTKIPVLGVCLGHQCLAEIFGGSVVRAERLMHGKTSGILHDAKGVFRGLSNPFAATRYHSLIVLNQALPAELEISAHTLEGEIMGLRARGTKTEGVQFHPESYMTKEGMILMKNFLEM